MNFSLAVQSFREGRLDDAELACRQILQCEPNHADSLHLLGAIAGTRGKHGEAAGFFRQAIAIRPLTADFHRNLAVSLSQQGQLQDAIGQLKTVIQLQPQDALAHCLLGTYLLRAGQPDLAIDYLQQALRYQPKLAMAHQNLATVYRKQGRLDAALEHYREAVSLNPGAVGSANDLAGLLLKRGNLTEAIAWLREIARRCPDDPQAHNNLGQALRSGGQLGQALASYRRAIELDPDFAEAHSNALFVQHYMPEVTLADLSASHAQWNQQHASRFNKDWRRFDQTPDPDRRLRLGFVSPDFGQHPVGHLIVGCLEALHSHPCETLCYSDRGGRDAVTQRIAEAAGTWRDVKGMSDDELATQIRQDRVDVLFDLAGHTAANRLTTFARKPAPLQASWLGYVGTTGLEAMDFLVADRFVVPTESDEFYQEQILRLPETRFCWAPPTDAPAVGPLPALSNGFVTFGSFNNPAKVTPDVLACWAEILARLPQSRLILKYRGFDDAELNSRVGQSLADAGVAARQIELRGPSSHDQMLAQYNEIDVAVDPFPFTGGATTCEALWMGVPVVTCPMETLASRQSLGILSTIGLTETIAQDLEQYVTLAVDLAKDPARLDGIRRSLRSQMSQSTLCDGDRFATQFLQALRQCWRDWCARQAT